MLTRPRPRPRVERAVAHVVLMMLALFSLFPIYWMFVTAVCPANEVLTGGGVPTRATLENLAYVWSRTPMGNMLVNTFVMATAANTAGQLFTSILAAYAFARWRFPGDRFLFLAFIGTWLIPFQVTMIPNYVVVARLGWLNTLAGLVVPQLAASFAVVLLRGYYEGLPRGGAGRRSHRRRVELAHPLVYHGAKPACAALRPRHPALHLTPE